MRSRLSLYLNSLSLEESFYLEEEINRRKDRYRRTYSVLSVQSAQRILRADQPVNLGQLARDMRKFIVDAAAQGGGIQLAYSPEVSVLMFTSVEGAGRTCAALLAGLPELNGKGGDGGTYRIGLKLGLATGEDILAPGSPRCVRKSSLVRRANQAAWRSTSGTLMMDENSYHKWPGMHEATRVPIEIDGHHVYRAVPGSVRNSHDHFDNDRINEFLERVRCAGISTLKYALERSEDAPDSVDAGSAWSKPVAIIDLHIEGYDAQTGQNVAYLERLSSSNYSERLDIIRRMLSDLGLALVRLETANIGSPSQSGASSSEHTHFIHPQENVALSSRNPENNK